MCYRRKYEHAAALVIWIILPSSLVAGDHAPLTPDTKFLSLPAMQFSEAFYKKGVELLAADNPSERGRAGEHLGRAATMRHTAAASLLGATHSFGFGSWKDDELAINWQEIAAKQSNPEAMLRLGLLHRIGMGVVPIDKKLGAAWLEKSVEFGNMQAAHLLGNLYFQGEGDYILANNKKALGLWSNAAKAGFLPSMNRLAAYWKKDNPIKATKWQAKADATESPSWMEDPYCLSGWECYRAAQ